MNGKESFPELAEHRYLDSLVTELHVSMFTALIAGADRHIIWPALDGTAVYAAVNLQPFDDYDRDPRPINAYRAVSRDWKIMRAKLGQESGTYDVMSYIVMFTHKGLELIVTENHGMPADTSNKRVVTQWLSAADESTKLQTQLGMTKATERDFAELENAMYDLRVYNVQNSAEYTEFNASRDLEHRMMGLDLD